MSLEKAKLTKKTYLNSNILECVLECDNKVVASPGQYILIKIYDVWRPFSIAEIQNDTILILVVQLIDKTVTADFFGTIGIGTDLLLQEPRGTLALPDKSDLVLIATGTGLIPLYTIALHLLENGYKHKIDIIFGVQSEDKLFYLEKLGILETNYKNCRIIIIISKPSDKWKGMHGRVSDYIKNHIAELNNRDYYICGRKETVASLVQQLDSYNIPDTRINFIE